MYLEGVGNVQTRIGISKSFYFSFTVQDADMFDIKEIRVPSHAIVNQRQSFSSEYWCSVQVGLHLFQVKELSDEVRWLTNLGNSTFDPR